MVGVRTVFFSGSLFLLAGIVQLQPYDSVVMCLSRS
jgi:hypothetical protein